jgi:drug/metabolite transporter (DMT)-like permease
MTASSSLRGIAAMVAGAGLLTLNDAVSKYLTEHYPIGEVVTLRQAAAMLFMLPYAWMTGGRQALKVVNVRGQLLRGLLFVLGTVLVLVSLSRLPLSFVTVVLFSSPLFVAMLSSPILGERVDAQQWVAIAAGFTGVMLIVRPAGGGFEWAVLLPLFAAMTNAVRDTYTRRLSRTDSSISVLFWSGVIVIVAGLFTVPLGWKAVDATGALWFLAAGLLNASAHFMVIEAFRLGHAATVAPFRYTGLLWAMLIGYLIWREVPDAWMLAGAAVVVAAGVYMLRLGSAKR